MKHSRDETFEETEDQKREKIKKLKITEKSEKSVKVDVENTTATTSESASQRKAELARKIMEKKAALESKNSILERVQAAMKKKAEREAQELAQKELHSTIQEVHDEQVKAKGGLNVAYHPALSMTIDPKARLSRNRNEFLIPKHATTMLNQKVANEAKPQKSLVKKKEIILEEDSIPDPSKSAYYDPNLKAQSGYQPQKRNRATFKFNEPGKFIDQADQIRKQQELDRLKQEIAEAARKAGMERDLALVSNQGLRNDPPPPVEWWDAKLLPAESYDDVVVEELSAVLGELINTIVQHPVPIEPPLEDGVVVAPKPLLLTKVERKKLRRQNRLEAQREKQDKIKLGLLPADQPRLTKSNFMRVLGQEAVLAPSMVEQAMARQVAERQAKHLEKIQAEKLTDEERRAKKDRKLTEDTSLSVHVCVFKITNLDHKQHLFKISKNAAQFKLTGVLILNPVMNLVIAEGGPKGISAYKHLLTTRIKWQERPEGALPLSEPNECVVVWEGIVKTRAFFHNFKTKRMEGVDEAKEFLESKGVVQYWNTARTLVTDAF